MPSPFDAHYAINQVCSASETSWFTYEIPKESQHLGIKKLPFLSISATYKILSVHAYGRFSVF
jgi:hypothetical protein